MQAPDVKEVSLGNAANTPSKGQRRGSDSKADHVRKRVKLFAELAIRAGGPAYKSVEGIEDNCQSDGLRGIVQIRAAALERGHHGIKAAKHVGHGHGAG